MTVFTVSMAGIPMEIHAMYPKTEEFCRDYLTRETPLFAVESFPEDLAEEQSLVDETAVLEGREPCAWRPEALERLIVFRRIAEQIPMQNAMLMHGSAVAFQGKAYLFTARSGTGKTTHTRLWLRNIPDTHVLNGDKPFLKLTDGQLFVCGTPWQGKENYGTNETLPLGGLCLLERDTVNHISSVSLRDAFPELLQQTYRPGTVEGMQSTLRLLGELEKIPLFRLGCNMDDEAALVSAGAMAGYKA